MPMAVDISAAAASSCAAKPHTNTSQRQVQVKTCAERGLTAQEKQAETAEATVQPGQIWLSVLSSHNPLKMTSKL